MIGFFLGYPASIIAEFRWRANHGIHS